MEGPDAAYLSTPSSPGSLPYLNLSASRGINVGFLMASAKKRHNEMLADNESLYFMKCTKRMAAGGVKCKQKFPNLDFFYACICFLVPQPSAEKCRPATDRQNLKGFFFVFFFLYFSLPGILWRDGKKCPCCRVFFICKVDTGN